MNGKTVVVVGGSAGIGWAVLERLSGEGAQVLHFSRSEGLRSELAGVRHRTFDAVRDPFPAEALPERLDGLVYCPGSIRLKPFARITAEEFLEDFDINVIGAVKVVQACLPALKKNPDGAAVVLFSTVAVQTGMPFHASIASAKGAVEGLTRSLAAELAPRIRVNAVAPSLTDTPLTSRLLGDEGKRKAAGDRHPLKRVGSPEDPAGAVVFLLGNSASWITGQVLAVDGGMGSIRLFQ
ncbi:SDR family NAD(P)-dependent oxidoreductase [Desulfococcus sp.]|uniref:SDR family NAD(P)-dependent oxidoreductase n=1 Tax=Desulfococcus sp. TaxID=2025834 RepID=UPI00359426BD